MTTPSGELISSDFPFAKKRVQVLGSEIAFVDIGKSRGPAVVFLHGNPTSSYLWRNIIPHVSDRARCIAPDLIGLGDSDKVPGLAYRVSDHIRYFDAFMDTIVPTEKIILVVHDWGSAIGFDWARRHEDRLAGISFMEFIPPIDAWAEMSPRFNDMFRNFRTPQLGRELLIEQNMFIEQVLPGSVVRSLSEAEMTEYRRPFLEPASREPVYRFPNEIPIEGEPKETWEMGQKYMAWLLASEVPKLFFWVTPGAIISEAKAKKLIETLKNTRSVYLGKGVHYVQEDHPHAIGRELAAWLPLNPESTL